MQTASNYQKKTARKPAAKTSAETSLCKTSGEGFFWCAMWQYLKVPNDELVSTR